MLDTDWRLSPSRIRWYLALGVLLPIGAALALGELTGTWSRLMLAGLAIWFARDTCRGLTSPVRGFSLREGQWYILLHGRTEAAELTDHHFIGTRLGVLGFTAATGERYRVSLLPDSMSRDAFRRLAATLA